jgi:DNA modification methylase
MNATVDIHVGHVLERLAELPEKSVHACVTSPPYWGLRDYKTDDVQFADGPGKLGLEPTLEQFIGHLVEVFEAVKRVLRDDGTCWVNLGDSYATQGGRTSDGRHWDGREKNTSTHRHRPETQRGIETGSLCLQPARFALAMQDAGWVLRSRIIWAKGLSFCDEYAGSVMPESVNGWRWERCRVKRPDKWYDCAGCEKCEFDGGWVLRQGSWRPTSAYEEILLFAKQGQRYYADGDAVREDGSGLTGGACFGKVELDGPGSRRCTDDENDAIRSGTRNLRNVWAINPQPFPEAHFATYPEKLIEPIIKAATSERGVCPECGAPWARVVERDSYYRHMTGDESPQKYAEVGQGHGCGGRGPKMNLGEQLSSTLGWRPTCKETTNEVCTLPPAKSDSSVSARGLSQVRSYLRCGNPAMAERPVPATVLDPFGGSGTTGLVARKLGRHAILIELNPQYAEMARRRIDGYAPLFS